MAELMETLEDWQAERTIVDCNKFMLHNEISCDITFLVGAKREPVRAHTFILISRSSVFQSIFTGSLYKDEGAIPVSDIEPATFKALLRFLYTDEVSLDGDIVSKLLYAAKKYAVRSLVKHCFSFLESSINTANVCSIIEQVHQYNGKDLETKCFSFIYEHAIEVLESDTFTEMCPSCVEQIVKSDELVMDEKLVYEAVLRWARKECSRRFIQDTDENLRTVLGVILYSVRFPLMHSVYFTNNVSSRNILLPQEVISIYQYFNGRSQPSNWTFNCCRRRGFSLHSAIRYNLILMENYTDVTHSIIFTCSDSILLHGAVVYGCLEGTEDYNIEISLHNVANSADLGRNYVTLSTNRNQHTYDVMLSKPVLLSPGNQYSMNVMMDGSPSKVGIHGKAYVSVEGVTFHFYSAESSKTTVEKGQIPGLLFTLPGAKQKS